MNKDIEAYLEQLKHQTNPKDIEFQQQLRMEVAKKKKEIHEIFFGSHQARHAILGGSRVTVSVSRDDAVRKSIPIQAALSKNKRNEALQSDKENSVLPAKNGNTAVASTSPERQEQNQSIENSRKGPFPFLKRTSKVPEPVKLNWENVSINFIA